MSAGLSWLLLLALGFCAYRLLFGIAGRAADENRADELLDAESLPLPDGVREWEVARLRAWWSAGAEQ